MPERQLKHYEYIVSLQETIICACIEDELPKARKRGIKPDNPRNIAPNIATVPAPPTSELVARHRTRFTKTFRVVDISSQCNGEKQGRNR